MTDFVLKEFIGNNIEQELESIGFDKAYQSKAADKFRYKNIKIYSLSVAQANILKQTALIFGADCAVNREVITGRAEKSDVILCGSFSQLRKIAQKLQSQPFRLAKLGEDILSLLETPKKKQTKLAGILNVTPDSFSDGGKYINSDDAIKHLAELIEDGADIVDIGAESTRPGALPVSANEQILRLKPILNFIQKENLKIPISIDTRSSEVADFALNTGASIINDVSGFDYDVRLADIISSYNAGVILQHSNGTPDVMQNNPVYANVMEDIYFSLKNKIEFAKSKNIQKIIIDPGIGFGKTKEDNLMILSRFQEFSTLGCPIMLGVSRKSFLGVMEDDNNLKDTLTLAVSYPLMAAGVDYLRVHNIKLHKSLLTKILST